MELSAIKPVEAILDIVHPGTNEPLGIKVPLKSLDDDAMKKVKLKIQNDEKNLARRGKSFTAEQVDANTSLLAFTAMSGWSWAGVTVEDQPARTEQKLVVDQVARTELRTVVDPNGETREVSTDVPEVSHIETVVIPAVTHFEDASFHGDKPAFNVANVYKVFEELPWFRDQIIEKVGDTKSFFTT